MIAMRNPEMHDRTKMLNRTMQRVEHKIVKSLMTQYCVGDHEGYAAGRTFSRRNPVNSKFEALPPNHTNLQ
jgi:hypothetical protein